MAELIGQIFSRPELVPHAIDFMGERLAFVEADRARIEQLPFIDGREPFGTDGPSVPVADALAADWQRPPAPNRFIFHVGFCGSTFLATLLQHAGAFVLREPHILIDVADAARRAGPLTHLAADLLRRPWRPGEPVVCKPSNWCNNLVPLLLPPERDAAAVFLTATPQQYLLAVLRGGTSRIENVARTAKHMLAAAPDAYEHWRQVMASTPDPLQRAARLALVALHAHLDAFKQAAAFSEERLFTLSDLESDPLALASRVAEALRLDMPAEAVEQALARVQGTHAKQPSDAYSLDERRALDAGVADQFAPVIRSALDWADQALTR